MSKNGLMRVDIASGAIRTRVNVVGINDVVLSTTGQRIYDTVQVTPGTEVIQERDGTTGVLLTSTPPMQGASPNELAIDAADAERLFTSYNAMGLGGTLSFYNLRLQVVASSRAATTTQQIGTAIPGFGGNAGVKISGGTVWVMSYNQYACFNALGELEAIGAPRAEFDTTIVEPIVVSNSGDFSFVEDGAASGLYRIEPPRKCRT